MRNYARPLLLLAALLSLLAAGCGGGGGSIPKDGVAKVGDKVITRASLQTLLMQAQRSYKQQGRDFPKAGSPEYLQLQAQALQFLVQREQYQQKADETGVTISDKKVADRLKQIKKQYFGGSEKRYLAELKKQGLTDTQVKRDIKAQLISEALFKRLTDKVKVTDQEARDYYAKNPEQYSTPESRDVAHILVKKKPLADSIYKQVTGRGDFAALAKKYSEDPGSKAQGGKLTVSKGQTVPEFDKVAFTLKTGTISKPVKTQYGFHVIKALSNIRPRKATPYKQVADAIRQQLTSTRRTEVITKWQNELKKEYEGKITYAKGYEPPETGTTGTTGATTTTG